MSAENIKVPTTKEAIAEMVRSIPLGLFEDRLTNIIYQQQQSIEFLEQQLRREKKSEGELPRKLGYMPNMPSFGLVGWAAILHAIYEALHNPEKNSKAPEIIRNRIGVTNADILNDIVLTIHERGRTPYDSPANEIGDYFQREFGINLYREVTP